MDFPTYQENGTKVTQQLTFALPTREESAAKTPEEQYLDRQWREVADGAGKEIPLSINRDSDYVTADPYTA